MMTIVKIIKAYVSLRVGVDFKTKTVAHNDTDYPYPIRILAGFQVIRPYSILIRILTKFMDTLFLTTLCPCMRHKSTAQWNNRLLLVTK